MPAIRLMRNRSLGETFRTEADALEVLGRAATAQAERVSSELREAASNLSRSTEVAATAGTEVRESFAEHAETIQGEIDRAVSRAQRGREDVLGQQAALEAAADAAEARIKAVRDTLGESSQSMD